MEDFLKKLDEISRKNFLLQVAKSTLGLSIAPHFLFGNDNGAPAKDKKATCERIIFLYMRGGMSQVDTFDPKTISP